MLGRIKVKEMLKTCEVYADKHKKLFNAKKNQFFCILLSLAHLKIHSYL